MFWDTLRSDIRHTLRMAVKAPLFTALTVMALALGIGATSAIFAVVNGVLLRPLPYRDADRLVNVWSYNTLESRPRNPISPANFLDFQKMNSTLETLEAYYTFMTPQQLRTAAGTELTYSVMVTPNMFNLLGRTAALGRALNVNDVPGVVVLSDGYWRRRFGGDPAIIGQTLDLSRFTAHVVGVMPPDFVFPYGNMFGPSGFTRVTAVDMWLPIAFTSQQAVADRMLTPQGQIVRSVHWFGAIGKLKAGVTPAVAEADVKTIAAQLEQSYPTTNKGWSATVVPTIDQTVGAVRPALLILLASIAAVLLMAAVNVANLMLARSVAREKELATRAALGAGRLRLVQQCLTESLLFSIAGGLAGLIVMRMGYSGTGRDGPRGPAANRRGQRGRARPHRDHAHCRVGRRRRRSPAGVQLHQHQPAGRVAGAESRLVWRGPSPCASRAGRHRSRAGRGAHDRRGASHAQLRQGVERRSRLPAGASADVADEHSHAAAVARRSARVLPRLLRAHPIAARRAEGGRHHTLAARQHARCQR